MAGTSIIARMAWIVLALVGAVMILSMFFPQYRKYMDLQEQVDVIDTEYRLEEERLQRLKHQQDQMQNDARFATRVAREELGLAKPGETIIKFLGDPSTPTHEN